ncbi:MAG: sodium:proton antiporter [Deltaproteobacteria bacterium]
MIWFQILVFLFCLGALFAYVDERFLHLQTTVGVMVLAMIASCVGYFLDELGVISWHSILMEFWEEFDFSSVLLKGLLCFFLFAGALHIPIKSLEKDKWMILALAVLGTCISTFVVGIAGWAVLGLIGVEISFLYMLLFGAIISPTDPIATLAILKNVGLPQRLETVINGESLFNDGVAMVLVTVISGLIYASSTHPSLANVTLMFVQEVAGGGILGIAVGLICNFMLRGVRQHSSEVLITLAAVTGGFTLAQYLEVSGPISIVAVGLVVGNFSRVETGENGARTDLDVFWKMIDEILDIVLFVLIGMLVVILSPTILSAAAAVIMVPIVLFARWISVTASILLLKIHERIGHRLWNVIKLLSWGGLRGGLPLALALSLNSGDDRDFILVIAYAVVAFSVIVQGLTIDRLFTKEELEKMAAS